MPISHFTQAFTITLLSVYFVNPFLKGILLSIMTRIKTLRPSADRGHSRGISLSIMTRIKTFVYITIIQKIGIAGKSKGSQLCGPQSCELSEKAYRCSRKKNDDMALKKAFVYGVAVEGENFTDCVSETKRLKQDFENGQNIVLISPRRMGKTSGT